MSNPKVNQTMWHLLGMVVLVCMILLILVTGTAEARYRAERDAEVAYQIEEPPQIYLGTMTEVTTETEGESTETPVMTFDPEGVPTWEKEDGIYRMNLAVANGSSEERFSEKDQLFRLRLIGTLGLGPLEAFPKIELHVPSEEDPEITEVFQMSLTRIKEGSELYHSVGAGWIIQFQNKDGEEPWWTLEESAFLYKRFTITMENVLADSDMLLRPQVEAKVVKD